MSYPCPVCAFPLEKAPWDDAGRASFEICPSCRIAFGGDDADDSGASIAGAHRRWREQWIADGMPWRSTTVPMPSDWPPAREAHFPDRGSIVSLPVSTFSDLGMPSNFTVSVRGGGWFDVQPGSWSIHLQEGGTGFSGAAATPDPDVALLVSAGEGWLVDRTTRGQTHVASLVYGAWGLPRQALLVINNHDHLIAVDGHGTVAWRTARLSMCSDFRSLTVAGNVLSGQAEGPDDWYEFSVDLATGASQGGWLVHPSHGGWVPPASSRR